MKNNQLVPHFLIVISSITVLSACSSQKDRVIGAWHLRSTCSRNGTTLTHESTTEFRKDGSYLKVGRMKGIWEANRKNVDASLSHETTGTWSINDDKIVENLVDFKLELKWFTKDGVTTPEFALDREAKEKITSNLGASIKKGSSSELSILSLSENKMSLKYKNSEDALAAGYCENQEYRKRDAL
jgi:hypothetical protein